MAITMEISGMQSNAPTPPPERSPVAGASSVRRDDGLSSVRNVENVRPKETKPEQQEASVDLVGRYSAQVLRNEQSNEVAKTVQKLNSVVENFEKMRANLTQIVKMYPPYPHDSDERAKLMSEVTGLRQLTEQLTIPPPYSLEVKKISGDPVLKNVNATDADLAKSLEGINGSIATIAAQVAQLSPQVSTGAESVAEQRSVSARIGLSSSATGVASESGRFLVEAVVR